jgi:hypothetical protein
MNCGQRTEIELFELLDTVKYYKKVRRNVHIPNGEVDAIGYYRVFVAGETTSIEHRIDLYEAKHLRKSKSVNKAHKQLKHARGYLGKKGNNYLYTSNHGIEELVI